MSKTRADYCHEQLHWVHIYIFNHLKLQYHVQICLLQVQYKLNVWRNCRSVCFEAWSENLKCTQDQLCWLFMLFVLGVILKIRRFSFGEAMCVFHVVLCICFCFSFSFFSYVCQCLHLAYTCMCMWEHWWKEKTATLKERGRRRESRARWQSRRLMASNKSDNWHASWQKHRRTDSKQRGEAKQSEVNIQLKVYLSPFVPQVKPSWGESSSCSQELPCVHLFCSIYDNHIPPHPS